MAAKVWYGNQYFEVPDEKFEEVAKAILPSDVTSANLHLVDFDEAVTLYGSYETPLIARLAHKESKGVTHYWGDKDIGGGTSVNAQADNFTLTTLTEIDTLPDRRSNTCQIIANLAAVGASQQAEAQKGGMLGIDDLVQDQRDDAMTMTLKDLEYSLVHAVENTGSPRQMEGLKKFIQDNSGVNYYSGSGNAFDEDILISRLETIRDRKTGYFPDALYCSGRILKKISSWTANRVNFSVDITRMDAAMSQLASLGAGQAAGFYVTPDGHVLKLYYHPNIAHSGTAGNNFVMGLTERLVRIAELRPLQVIPSAKLTDGFYEVVLIECTVEIKVPPAHGVLYNFSAS